MLPLPKPSGLQNVIAIRLPASDISFRDGRSTLECQVAQQIILILKQSQCSNYLSATLAYVILEGVAYPKLAVTFANNYRCETIAMSDINLVKTVKAF